MSDTLPIIGQNYPVAGDSGDAYNILSDDNLVLKKGFNMTAIMSDNIEVPLVGGLGYFRITHDIDQTTRAMRITIPDGLTINGITDSFILSGGQLSQYAFYENPVNAYTMIAQADAPFTIDSVPSGAIATASVNSSGVWFGATAGTHAATQVATTGIGAGATFSVVMDTSSVTSISSITNAGSGYNVGDLITIEVSPAGGTELIAATIRVDSVS